MVRESKLPTLNFFVGLLHFNRFERRSSTKHCVKDNANAPVVNFIRMAIGALKDLRGQVIRSSTDGTLTLALVKDLSSKAEIADFELHALSQEEISKFEISMDDILLVDVLDTTNELMDVVAGLNFGQTFASANQI